MNSLFILLGLESWKPVLTALLLPPVPLLLMVLVGARLIVSRRGLGWGVVALSVALLWFSACTVTAAALARNLLQAPVPLSVDRILQLKAASRTPTAIVVLGGGLEPLAPEYATSNLHHPSLERLRYGIWLSRATGLPLAFSGGVGWAQPGAMPEAQIAARIAEMEFGRPLKWVEADSRDTRENAARSVALLAPAGIRHIVLVTHGWHMARAQRAFEAAAAGSIRIEAAPMGLAQHIERPVLGWIPSALGTTQVRTLLREWIGRLSGA